RGAPPWPCTRVLPVGPGGPTLPCGPTPPVAPAGPGSPCNPVLPVAPGGPGGPADPVGPGSPCGPGGPPAGNAIFCPPWYSRNVLPSYQISPLTGVRLVVAPNRARLLRLNS